ncbi:hypothetical protein [Alicyclobacillus dauci]|uniref:Uncharacterized protein n=1 Tax=Alicyclobacillus dauci TaxID=1475485 RepID=A0ABY6Z6E6_9BACL|nr:hypothetical protein [Alicyclobacillus dauci]WAH38445.1 hypothetical protein NZD86_08185 [Alicyclobacillus dauci]
MYMHTIVYDLHKPDEDGYTRLTLAIKKECPDHFEIQRSVWIVGSNKSNAELLDTLTESLPSKGYDKLFVSSITLGSQWRNIRGLADFFQTTRTK